jgi:hypothetical protein
MAKSTTARTTTTAAPVATHDHLRAALLAHLNGGSRADDCITEMASRILETDNDPMHGDEGICDSVLSAAAKRYQRGTAATLHNAADLSTHARMMQEIISYGRMPLTCDDSAVAFDIAISLITTSTLLGAALMYSMLRGGAR